MRTPMKRFGQTRGAGRRGGLPRVRRGDVRHRAAARRRRRVPRERSQSMKAALVISERDNVATALEPLEPGGVLDGRRRVGDGARADPARTQDRASRDSPPGEPVVKYGSPIGIGHGGHRAPARTCTRTTSPAAAGAAISTRQPVAGAPAGRAAGRRSGVGRAHDRMTDRPGFLGYRRPDGRVGTRNHVLVVPTVICSAVVAERIAAAAAPVGAALPHLAGLRPARARHAASRTTRSPPTAGIRTSAPSSSSRSAASRSSRRRSPTPRGAHGKPVEIVAIQSRGRHRPRRPRRAARSRRRWPSALAAHAARVVRRRPS